MSGSGGLQVRVQRRCDVVEIGAGAKGGGGNAIWKGVGEAWDGGEESICGGKPVRGGGGEGKLEVGKTQLGENFGRLRLIGDPQGRGACEHGQKAAMQAH